MDVYICYKLQLSCSMIYFLIMFIFFCFIFDLTYTEDECEAETLRSKEHQKPPEKNNIKVNNG